MELRYTFRHKGFITYRYMTPNEFAGGPGGHIAHVKVINARLRLVALIDFIVIKGVMTPKIRCRQGIHKSTIKAVRILVSRMMSHFYIVLESQHPTVQP